MNAVNAKPTQPAIVKEIAINAPAAKVFAALTEPDQLTQWWGDERYHTEHMVVDLRVGGRWRTTGRSADGQEFAVEGVYRAIDPPHLLEYTWAHDWGNRSETLVHIELTERDGTTVVQVTHSGFVDRKERDDHEGGWGKVLGWLRAYAETTA